MLSGGLLAGVGLGSIFGCFRNHSPILFVFRQNRKSGLRFFLGILSDQYWIALFFLR